MIEDQRRHRRVSDLFQQALGIGESQRAAFLNDACRHEPTIRKEVEAMLVSAVDAEERLGGEAGAPFRTMVQALVKEPGGDLESREFGGFEDVQFVAEGGMSRVYKGWQLQPRREVAIKILPALTSAWQERFRREVDVLGRLRHPSIAQIYDAGSEEGCHYFAMEWIRGGNLLADAKKRDLSIRERVESIIQLCDAVHHAHQKGIIHRDLKPDNVLVDEAGQPKVLDFGIAKLLDAEDGDSLTRMGHVMGTPGYMSPEQACSSDDVDIRSDVYSLGVVAFELLSGQRPHELPCEDFAKSLQILLETPPTPLGRLCPTLRGDLESVVGHALATDRDRRYGSAQAFADDLRRYLNSEPVQARPSTAFHRLKLLARRRKLATGSVLFALLSLIGGLVTSLALNEQTKRALAVAAEQSQSKDAFIDIIEDVFNAAGPNDVTHLRDLVAQLEKALVSIPPHEVLGEIFVRQTIALSFMALALFDEAEAHVEESLRLAEEHQLVKEVWEQRYNRALLEHRRTNIEEASSRTESLLRDIPSELVGLRRTASRLLARVYLDAKRFQRAEEIVRDLIAQAESHGDETLVMDLYEQLFTILVTSGRPEEGREILDRYPISSDELDNPRAANFIAHLNYQSGNWEEAILWAKREFASRQRFYGPSHPILLESMKNLAVMQWRGGELIEASRLFEQLCSRLEELYGPWNRRTVQAIWFRVQAKVDSLPFPDRGDFLHRRVNEVAAEMGGDHPEVKVLQWRLAKHLSVLGRHQEAISTYRSVEERLRGAFGKDEALVFSIRSGMVNVLRHLNELAEAESLARETLDVIGSSPRDLREHRAEMLANLGLVFMDREQYEPARIAFEDALESVRGRKTFAQLPMVEMNLGVCYLQSGRVDDAISRLEAACPDLRAPTNRADCLYNLGMAHLRKGRWRLSEDLARESLAIRYEQLGIGDPAFGRLADLLVVILTRAGERELEQKHLAKQGQNGQGRLDEAYLLSNMRWAAGLRTDRDEFRAAQRMLETTLTRQVELYGEASPEVVLTRVELAILAHREGNTGESEDLFGGIDESLETMNPEGWEWLGAYVENQMGLCLLEDSPEDGRSLIEGSSDELTELPVGSWEWRRVQKAIAAIR